MHVHPCCHHHLAACLCKCYYFFFNDTATTEIYTLSLHDALPIPHEPCITAPMKPRERTGQVSIARAAPAGHSAPMPMPSSARKRKSKKKLGARPARKLQTEYQAIEIISGVLRPIRSASQPLAVALSSRIQRVTV